MRTMSFFLILVTVASFSFDIQAFLGYTYGDYNGWTLGTGFYQEPFGSDVMMTFQASSPTNFFAFHFSGFVPLFSVGEILTGPAAVYVHSNYSGEWEDNAWVGIVIENWNEDFHLRLSLLYPIQKEFDFSRDLVVEFRYFLKPPGGLRFKDRLYFDMAYVGGIFRFGIGLLEPLP
jgi:hypothetical protein